MTKIILYCCDKVGKTMAGPAIRYWELAKSLSKSHEVTLYTLNEPDIKAEGFHLVSSQQMPLSQLLALNEVMLTQVISGKIAFAAKMHGVKLILDAYAPEPLEHLEIFRFDSLSKRQEQAKKSVSNLKFALKMADGIICANKQQKDLWTGLLLSLHRVTPGVYDQNPSLDNFISIVPFGLSATPPEKGEGSFRKLFGFSQNDFLLVWGGGIWNWFDPLTLIHAMKVVSLKYSHIHLVFMGTQHPNEKVPQMKMAADAVKLAEELDLLNKQVFFNQNWIPYQERGSYLIDADLGVSAHFDYLETRFSFRTRILDYFWSGLPILATEGDSFAELIKNHQLGITVPYKNVESFAQAILSFAEDKKLSIRARENIATVRTQFYWDRVAQPLDAMIQRLSRQPGIKKSKLKAFQETGQELVRIHGIKNILKTVCKKAFS